MRNPLLFLCTALSACVASETDDLEGIRRDDGVVTHFPRRSIGTSEWVAGGEALIAGRLIIANGCLSLQTAGEIRPIVWHREAQLAAGGRRVIDTVTGRSVSVGQVVSIAGGVYDRPDVRRSDQSYDDLPAKCTGDKLIVVGSGFYD